jgi:DNA-directed RNA polymerase III subunit RPC1
VRVRIYSFNECVCTPYNADFDGDEMNLHVPQTHEARAEADVLMSVRSNLCTPRSGEPLVAAIQDFITGGYLLTHKDTFLCRADVDRLVATLLNGPDLCARVHLPPPAIFAPSPLWTGKQLVQLIIAVDHRSSVRLNLATPNKSYKRGEELDATDSYVLIRNSVLLAGCLDKALLGSSSKTNIFYILMRDYGNAAAVDAMWRLGRLAPAYLMNRGFSIGIGDVRPGAALVAAKRRLVDDGYSACDTLIREEHEGRLRALAGCSPAQALESGILKELSAIRDRAGQACLANLSKHNAPLTMAVCGSKG